MIRHSQENQTPLYIVRYEDLVTHPKETLMGLMCYLFDKRDLTGTNMERRIEQVLAKPSKSLPRLSVLLCGAPKNMSVCCQYWVTGPRAVVN